MSQTLIPKKSLSEINGIFFDEFKLMLDELYTKVAMTDFDNLIKIEIDTNNLESKSIHRFNVKMFIQRLENAHTIAKTENSVKWLKFLKRYALQFSGI